MNYENPWEILDHLILNYYTNDKYETLENMLEEMALQDFYEELYYEVHL